MKRIVTKDGTIVLSLKKDEREIRPEYTDLLDLTQVDEHGLSSLSAGESIPDVAPAKSTAKSIFRHPVAPQSATSMTCGGQGSNRPNACKHRGNLNAWRWN